MKRIGFVWEELVSIDNCENAVLDALRNKRKTPYLRHIQQNYKEYGEKIQQIMIDGWVPEKTRKKTINEGTRNKIRHLKIPSLIDHMIHTAVARILSKYLTKRFYFYACGSLPHRGQTFACKALEGNVRKKQPKYCLLSDVKKFYPSLKKGVVMRCLRRVFKDKRFLMINNLILDQMEDGLAIGFTVSHWYAQLVMFFVDQELKSNTHGKVFMVRFMDNYVITCSRKRTLHKLLRKLMDILLNYGLRVKEDWQVFPIKDRMIEFLQYRFNHDKTILRKPLMIRMSRRYSVIHKNGLTAHKARVVMSDRGILKYCNSYNFRKDYLYPNVSLKVCRRLISNADKKRSLQRETRTSYCDYLRVGLYC